MKIMTNIDVNNNEIVNAVINGITMKPLTEAPTNAKEGEFYYNFTEKKAYQYNGTEWIPMGGSEFNIKNIKDGEAPGSIIEGEGGSTNIDNAHIEGYNSGGVVYGVRPYSLDLFVCKVEPKSGELISVEGKIDATYDTSDPNNRAAGTYIYKGEEYYLSNVTSSDEVKTVLGLGEEERICLRVGVGDINLLTVGMTYNFCYPEGSKQRYGKVIGHTSEHIMIDGECNAIHRSVSVHSLELPPPTDSFSGNFIFNGGKDGFGDFPIASAVGMSTHSEGVETYASIGGHSEGNGTQALSFASHAEGENSIASGFGSHAEGAATQALGHQSHAEGELTEAKGYASHAEGQQSVAEGSTSHAEGNMTLASGRISHAEGNNTKATNNYSHAEGHYTEASGMASHAEGGSTKVISTYGHVEGNNNIVGQESNTGEIEYTVTITPVADRDLILFGIYDDLEGNTVDFDCYIDKGNNETIKVLTNCSNYPTIVSIMDWETGVDDVTSLYKISNSYKEKIIIQGIAAHAEGQDNDAWADFSHAEGRGTKATGVASHSEGQATISSNKQSHAEGYQTQATGERAHAEGNSTKATNAMTHAEGYSTTASGQYAHSEGWLSEASGQVGHSEGYKTKASGRFSHAQGRETEASGSASSAGGLGTKATGANQTVDGKYNKPNANMAHIVGNGESDTVRSNAYALDWKGNAYFAGEVFVGNANETDKAKKLATKSYTDKIKPLVVTSEIEIDTTNGTEMENIKINIASVDKSFEEIYLAYNEGRAVYMTFKLLVENYIANLNEIYVLDDHEHIGFECVVDNYIAFITYDNTDEIPWGYQMIELNNDTYIQSDWNQNDSTQRDYIKNRPFYKEENVPVDYFDIVLDYEANNGEMWMVLDRTIGLLPDVIYTMDALDIDGNIISTAQISTYDAGDGVICTFDGINGVYMYDYSDDFWSYSDNSALIEWGYDGGTTAYTIRIHGVPSIGTLYHKIPQEYLDLTGLGEQSDWIESDITKPSYIKNKPTDLATLTDVDNKIAELVNSAPETLNTLNELAKALGEDPNFASTVAAQIGTKLSINAGYDNEGKYLKVVNGKATWVNIPNAEEVSF